MLARVRSTCNPPRSSAETAVPGSVSLVSQLAAPCVSAFLLRKEGQDKRDKKETRNCNLDLPLASPASLSTYNPQPDNFGCSDWTLRMAKV